MPFGRTNVSIYGWGVYIPRFRLRTSEVSRVWLSGTVGSGGGPCPVKEKAVVNVDEDTITMAIEAARRALRRAKINPRDLGAVLVGTESSPYAVKPAGALVARAIGAGNFILTATYEFACKAATEALHTCVGLVESRKISFGLVIGSDTAQGRPSDELEYTAACGAVALVVGRRSSDAAATIEACVSYVREIPDFWRREGRAYPRHTQRFTGEPAYFHCVLSAARALMEMLGASPSDFDYVVFHQPNVKFPLRAAKALGFSESKVVPGLVVDRVGNIYSGSALLGLACVLDVAKPGERILLVSYGSGAGSDAFAIVVEEGVEDRRRLAPTVSEILSVGRLVDYALYARLRRKILGG